jgi:hypothetical protein
MNTQDILNSLSGFDAVKSHALEAAATELKDLTNNYQNGKLSASEYEELLSDISTTGIIIEDAAALNAQAELNKIIEIAITIASTAAKAI